MNKLEKDLQGAYDFLQLVALLLIFPVIIYWIWRWIFEYNAWQKIFTALWVGIVFYYFDLIPGFHPY